MKPPVFVWKSGVLDVFDTAAELPERYAADDLAGEDVAVYDSKGRALRACAEPDGATRMVCDASQPPQPERLVALLRGYLERGGASAESIASLTLPELIEKVYPSNAPPERPRRAKGKHKSRRRPDDQSADEQAVGRFVDAFGIAVLAEAIGACVGAGLALFYYISFPTTLSSGFGAMGEFVEGLLMGADAGALIGGTLAYFWALWRFDLYGTIHAEKIGCAFIALIAVPAAVGVTAWVVRISS